MTPETRLYTGKDVEIWSDSQTKSDLVKFITSLAESIKGHEDTQYQEPISDTVQSTMQLLGNINSLIDKHPVVEDANTSRFGKVEFRDFYDDLQGQSKHIIATAYPSLNERQVEQFLVYLCESWGNRERIDYGSGHELNFICFLYGLYTYKVFELKRDATNLILKVFIEYLRIMRILETKYWLEPAGSHGVWGLDDYHFLPFLFGAYQLVIHPHLRPKSIHNPEVVEMFAHKYMYFGCVAFINSVKTASLRWNSPMLDDISGVKTWAKVAEGMVKMYKAEVLGKLPIMQHFYFSEFLPCPEGVSPPKGADVGQSPCDEEHAHNTWGGCCGIKIPSAVAVRESSKHNGHTIPFD